MNIFFLLPYSFAISILQLQLVASSAFSCVDSLVQPSLSRTRLINVVLDVSFSISIHSYTFVYCICKQVDQTQNFEAGILDLAL